MKLSPHGARVVPDGGRDDQRLLVTERHAWSDQSVDRGRPVRMGEDPGPDVRDEHGRERHQHVLDAVEAPAEDEPRDRHGRHGNSQVAADAQQVSPGGDAGELGGGRAQVGQ